MELRIAGPLCVIPTDKERMGAIHAPPYTTSSFGIRFALGPCEDSDWHTAHIVRACLCVSVFDDRSKVSPALDPNIGRGSSPECEEVLVMGSSRAMIAAHGLGARELQAQ